VRTSTIKANIHIVPFQFDKKTATLSFCKVVWRRYLGEVGKFYRTLWLIYPRTAYQFLSKSVKFCRSYDKKLVCFYASQCII